MIFGVTGFIFEKTGKIRKFPETRSSYFYKKFSMLNMARFFAHGRMKCFISVRASTVLILVHSTQEMANG